MAEKQSHRFALALRRALLLIPTLFAVAFFATAGWLLLTQSGLERTAALVAWVSEDAVHIAGARGRLVGPLALDRLS